MRFNPCAKDFLKKCLITVYYKCFNHFKYNIQCTSENFLPLLVPINLQDTWRKVEVTLLIFIQIMSSQHILTPLLESCQTWYSAVDDPRDFQVTWSKVKVKQLVFEQIMSNICPESWYLKEYNWEVFNLSGYTTPPFPPPPFTT